MSFRRLLTSISRTVIAHSASTPLFSAHRSLSLPLLKMSTASIRYLSQQEASDIDRQLMADNQFSLDQLMELAGLSCATAVARELPAASNGRVLVVCGPGNNGGDGLVCARHLRHFGVPVSVFHPMVPSLRGADASPLHQRLLSLCDGVGARVLPDETTAADEVPECVMLIDALFGFGFRPPVRPQYAGAMRLLTETARRHDVRVCSLDVPSGWHVDGGPPADERETQLVVRPHLLVSLTAPKLCARQFDGVHYLGGRFVPDALQRQFNLNLPPYPGTDCVLKLSG